MKRLLILAIMVLALLVPTSVMAANPVPMTTTTVAQVASITVDQSSMAFERVGGGAVVVGTDSAPVSITVRNSGNIPITVTVAVGGADAAFYNACLYLDPEGTGYDIVGSWHYTTAIPVGGAITVNAKIHPLSVITGGVGTLTFVATPAT